MPIAQGGLAPTTQTPMNTPAAPASSSMPAPTPSPMQPFTKASMPSMQTQWLKARPTAMAAGGGAEGGSGGMTKLHVGPIHSSVAGRTDHLPMHVPSGSYVIPADIISAMGEGNTMAGFKHMRRMFGGTPYGAGDGIYGQGDGPYGETVGKSAGGATESVPIVAAGGEYVLSPHQVQHVAGAGDLERGQRVLDEWVKRMRKQTVKTLQKLPGPKNN